MVQTRVAIIGAGVSGLAAAVKLADQGHAVTLFEARREAGGRTRSYVDAKTGDVLDNGQHLLMGCYTATQEYLAMIGTEKLVTRIPMSVKFWTSPLPLDKGRVGEGSHPPPAPPSSRGGGVTSFTIDKALPPPMNLISAIMRTSLISFTEKKAAATIGNIIYRDKLPRRIDDMTCSELFAKCEQPTSVVEKLWKPLVVATINARPEQASATLFVNVIREAFFSSRTASNALIPNVGLSELLVDPALKKLEAASATVRLGTPVRRIERTNDDFNVITDEQAYAFKYIISATPEPLYPAAHTSYPMQTSPIVNAYLWLDKQITSSPIHAFIGMTVEWAFPKESSFSAQRLALTVSAADELVERSNEEITEILWGDLQRTMPAARDAKLMHSQIIKEKRATPLLTPSVQNTRPDAATHDKQFILAGDIVQNGLPATIEGAVRNGFRAAALVE